MGSNIYDSALEQAELIRTKKVSSEELTERYIRRIEKYDNEINAVIVRTFDDALERAKEADSALARGEQLGPLHGVPMTIKESYVMANTPSTWGIEAFKNNYSDSDGLAVRRFRAAGAVFLGKTNVPTDLADFQSYNPIYGVTGNPYDPTRTPGGSSGGSAASLASGFSALEAGSDIGGSIRNPAHFCGIYGHKPTYGIVPMQGHELVPGIPEADLAVCGPLARSADDLAVALDIMARPVDREAIALRVDLPRADFAELKDLRVAIWASDDIAPVSQDTINRANQVARILRDEGATVSEEVRPNFDTAFAHANYQSLLTAVMTSAMRPAEVKLALAAAAELDPDDRSISAVNTRATVMSHRDWIRTNTRREKLRRAWDEFFQEWDILVCPQMATSAFPHDHRPFGDRVIMVDQTEQSYFKQIFWAGMIVNAYLPSTVFPTGLDADGLPIGLQAVSAPYRDHRTIEFAKQITQHIGGFEAPENMIG